jgi:hypothetical protein
MKTYTAYLSVIALTFIIFFVLNGCKNDDEDEPLSGTNLQGIEGTFEFKSAIFREMVDFDGDGPIQPTQDALFSLYDIFNIYESCASDLPIFEFKANKIYHLCTETGQSRDMGDFKFFRTDSQMIIDITLYEWNDPMDFFVEWTTLRLEIKEATLSANLWTFQGAGDLELTVNPGILVKYDFEMQEVVID